jgi:hypothetical protein
MEVVTVNDANFKDQVVDKARLAVVEFSAKKKETASGGANASAKMDAVFDEVARGFSDTDKIGFFRVEIQLNDELIDAENPLTSKTYAINHGPTTVFIKDGKEIIRQLVGHYLAAEFKNKVDEALKA